MKKNIVAAIGAIGLAAGVIVAINWPVATGEAGNCAEAVAAVKGFKNSKGKATPQDTPFYQGEAGKETRLSDFAGRGVVMNFWATWCTPCIKEMPSLLRLKQTAPDGVDVVIVSEDREGVAVVKPFLEKNNWQELGITIDRKSALMRGFVAQGLPTTVLIAPDGREAARLVGITEWDRPDVVAMINACIKPKG